MNVENNNPNIGVVNWRYLPNIYQLSQYLPQSDLIQLSLTCSQFRNKLNSTIFRKLVLMRGSVVIPDKPNISSKRRQLISLFEMLEEDYIEKYNIVKHCVIWDSFNSRFAKDFFNLLNNITKLELCLSYNGDYYYRHSNSDINGSNLVLIEALYPLRKLESLKISSELIDDYESSKHELYFRDLNFYPIESINEEYSNLKQVNIINEKMLSNMSIRMESLTDVTIFNRQDFDIRNLVKFLSLNPQLEKLTIPDHLIEYRLANSILQMQHLKQLNIEYSIHGELDAINNLPVNTSIEHLNIICNTSTNRLVPFLNNLKSLKVLEFSNNNLRNFAKIDFSSCTNRIPLLHLNSLKLNIYYISRFNNQKIFDRIRLTNMYDLDYYLANSERNSLEDWDIYNLGPANSRDFTLIKKT
ncbi:hypothetical protein CONCODRAFT_11546 [Conidiobolus coronatus NRRL 28638]|uniref:F-box domain-containing protein n=1 Tax=Conidiobolus coronatus (strain ATCC 28846 / CBS 209.66 / NRRL 28638) TaxID=796925 RepID=A0A137NUT5_CONC2|nr:hypothetical protein CONCODRAFT_11546 [Conidiobolus coronatus NRRL 28638]|eukprot:KXN66563.1 hypothetical protein CONCODRAFT_11546 [Conidiobolus coronatus NRRL 28638]